MSLRNIDTSNLPPEEARDFAPIPKGRYKAEVGTVEWKNAKSGGQYLEVMYFLPEVNRRLWDRLNLFHQNEQAVAIAKRRLLQLREATGRDGGDDGEEFLDCPVMLEVGVRTNSGTGKEENTIYAVSAPQAVAKSASGMQNSQNANRPQPQQRQESFPTQKAGRPAPQPARQWGKIPPARGAVADDMPF